MTVNAVFTALLLLFACNLPSFCQSKASSPQVQAHLRQAQEFLSKGQPDLALAEFRAVLTLDPHNVNARGNLGTLLYFRRDYEKAATELRATLKSNPGLWKIQTLLGMSEKRTGNVAGARADLEQAFPRLEETKLRVEAGMELIDLYYSSRELDKAADIIGALRRLKPEDAGILFAAHRIYSEQADEAMLGVSMLAPDSVWMHRMMAQEMVRQGNSQGAAAHFRSALKIDPLNPGVHFELAELLSSSSAVSEQQEAEAEYRTAIAQNPQDEKSECRLGRIAFKASDFNSAASHYARALALQSGDPEANLGLGRVFIAMNEPAKALPLLENAVRLDPSDGVARFRLGTLYRQTGRADDARLQLAEYQHLKDMKEKLVNVYKEMRVHGKALGESEAPND